MENMLFHFEFVVAFQENGLLRPLRIHLPRQGHYFRRVVSPVYQIPYLDQHFIFFVPFAGNQLAERVITAVYITDHKIIHLTEPPLLKEKLKMRKDQIDPDLAFCLWKFHSYSWSCSSIEEIGTITSIWRAWFTNVAGSNPPYSPSRFKRTRSLEDTEILLAFA